MKNEHAAGAEGGVAFQIARWVALGTLFLIPLTPLFVANTYFFPFITGKAFYFRILVEILVGAWVTLAFLHKDYRPRFSWIGAAVVAFVAWMFVADFFAINVAKAFWSNFERMEGWVLLIHLLGFFFASSAVLRAEKKWRAWFLASIAVSVVISGYALFQLAGSLAIHQGANRLDATLGNSAYLAIYFFFTACLAFWLALTEKRGWLKWSLVALATLESGLIFFTETRGTILAFVGALGLASLLTALTAGKRARRYAAGAFACLVLLIGGFYFARDSVFVQSNHILQRIATISPADGQVRFTLWGMALEGVKDRPVFGWGQEGFNYVFNTYYNPALYAQEPWFDRAHNAFIDWLIAGGVPGFLLYLSLFASALIFLWRSSEVSRIERIALTAALLGYAIHNLFVFDNLYSYIYFFAILAYIDSQVARPCRGLEHAPALTEEDGITYLLPVATVVVCAFIWTVNASGMRVASELIVALSPSQEGGIAENLASFSNLAAHPSFAGQEIREQIVSFAASAAQNTSLNTEDKQKAVTLAIEEMKKQVAAYPLDARERLELSFAYRAAGDGENAMKELQAAAALSPKKEEFLIEEGALAWDLHDTVAAQKYFAAAYALGPQFQALAAYAAAGDFAVGDIAHAESILQKAYGTTTVDADVLAVAYYRTKDWPRLIAIWKLRVQAAGATSQTWFGLASAQYAAGKYADAIATIKTAIAKHPEAKASGEAAIAQIEGRTVGK